MNLGQALWNDGWLASLLVLLLGSGAARSLAQITDDGALSAKPIHIRVDAAHPAAAVIPETIFGSFLEPIDHSTYGGLWAELLENPTFDEGLWSATALAKIIRERPEFESSSTLDLPIPWEPLDAHQGNRYEPEVRGAVNGARSLLIMALPEGETGIRQRIYLPVHRVLAYQGSIWLKHQSGNAEIHLSLRERNNPGRMMAEAVVKGDKQEWNRYPFTLNLKAGQVEDLQPVDFVVSLLQDGRTSVGSISFMPSDAIEGMDPDVIQMARELKSPIIRFGGNFTSSYHWKNGIGPADQRVARSNLAWNIPEYNTFGTDEFLRFCELIGAKPQVALNLGSGTPEEAAQWVRYINAHWGNKQGGLLWELGNELWGNWNMGYPTRDQIGTRTEAFSKAIREADPKAQLIATGADEDFFHDWNANQLATDPGTFDYLSTHFVVTDDQDQQAGASADFVALSTFALPISLEKRMEEMTAQIKQSSHPNVKIAFTEWLFVPGRHPAPGFNNMGGAVATGGFLNMLLRKSDIVPISDMTGILDFAGINKKREQVYGAPGYWVLRAYSEQRPSRLLPISNDGPSYSVDHGATRLPHVDHVPWLEVVAAQGSTPDKLLLFCVNRSLTRDYRASVQFSGFLPAKTADVKTITASSIYSENDEMNPQQIEAVSSHSSVGATFEYTFPHASVVVVSLQRKAH